MPSILCCCRPSTAWPVRLYLMAAYHSTPASALSSPQLPLLQYSDLNTGEDLVYNILLALTLSLALCYPLSLSF